MVQRESVSGPLAPGITMFPLRGSREADLDMDVTEVQNPFILSILVCGYILRKVVPVHLSCEDNVTTSL